MISPQCSRVLAWLPRTKSAVMTGTAVLRSCSAPMSVALSSATPECMQRLDLATSEVAAGGTVVSSLPPPAPLLYAEPPVQATAPAPVPARQLLSRPMPFTQLPPQPVMPVLQRRCKSRRKWRADPARQEFYCLWKPALIVQHSLRAAR